MKERPILFTTPMVQAQQAGRKNQTRRTKGLDYLNENPGRWKYLGIAGLESNPKHLFEIGTGRHSVYCSYGKVGDHLWVRETWADVNLEGAPGIAYRASDDIRDLMEENDFLCDDGSFNYQDRRLKYGKSELMFGCWHSDLLSGAEGKWRASIHMPRWVSRITLVITGVRIERLQNISEEDATREGVEFDKDFGWCCYQCDKNGHFGTSICEDGFYKSARESFQSLWLSIHGQKSWEENPWVWVIEFKNLENVN